MSADVDEVAKAINEIVGAAGELHGSGLATALKARIPSWSPADAGARSLREFITGQVPTIALVRRSGMDVVYAPSGAPSAAPVVSPLPPSDADFWRIWVSPNSPHALAVDQKLGTLRAVARRSVLPAGEVLLEPPGVTDHRAIADGFLKRTPPALRARLRSVLDSPSEAWWQVWLRELRNSEELSGWNAFRREQLEDALAARLRAAGLEQAPLDAALAFVRERRLVTAPRPRREHKAEPTVHGEIALRGLVIKAVERMSAAELRELRLPLGIVLDALAASKSG